MAEPLSSDRVFDFPVDEPEPHPPYDFFAPRPLSGYAGNPNNNNGWIEVDVPILGELGVVANEPMVGPIVDEIAEPIVEAKEQVIALVVDVDEDIAMLFSDDDFEDDDSEGFDEEEVWEVNEEWLMAPVTPPPMQAVPLPSVYELVKKVIQVSDAEVAAGISIGEIGLRIFAIEGDHTHRVNPRTSFTHTCKCFYKASLAPSDTWEATLAIPSTLIGGRDVERDQRLRLDGLESRAKMNEVGSVSWT
ncbi:hypothetical protein Tco_0270324 [Tanacetum coccineum]